MRFLAALVAVGLAGALLGAEPRPRLTSLLDGASVVEVTIDAPLAQLFADDRAEKDASVPATLRYRDPAGGGEVLLDDTTLSVRGHTSRRETECSFPKLKLHSKDAGTIKIGTHCGEAPAGQLTPKYGRLANERSPLREGLVYRMLDAAGVPTLRSRAARVTYRDRAAGSAPLTRNALLLEDDDDAIARAGGTSEVPMERFTSVAQRGAAAQAAEIAFGEAMIGNFDWCLRFSPDDRYRCDASKPLWNVLGFERGGALGLMPKDFDLAGIVVGRHPWFDTVWNRDFAESRSPIDIEVLSQVQRTRSLFGRAELDAVRQRFLARQAAVLAAIEQAPVDEEGRALARQYARAFFSAIADDDAFYRPVVGRPGVQLFLDAQGAREACGAGDVIPPGTPVNEVRRSGTMSQVVILDVQWHWTSKHACSTVQRAPVWIASDAITLDYPSRKVP